MLLRWKRLRSWSSRASRRGRQAARNHRPVFDRNQAARARIARNMDLAWDGAVLGQPKSLAGSPRDLRGFVRWLASG